MGKTLSAPGMVAVKLQVEKESRWDEGGLSGGRRIA